MHSNIVQQFEDFLQKNLPIANSFHPHYNEALSFMFEAGGKRFRPYLLLNLVKHYQPLLLKSAFFAASAVEMLHTYSLIHDDLPCMDDSPLRRGRESLHVKYDEVTAVLVGDALNTHAFYMLSIAPFRDDMRVKLVKSLSEDGGVNGMVLGQAIDCHFEDKKLSFEELKFLHVNKTAKLIASSLKMGAIISGLDDKSIDKWYKFGLDLGVLFQIRDDLLDVNATEKEIGKPIGNDEHKNTYVSILGLDGAKKQHDELLSKICKSLQEFPKPLQDEFGFMIEKYFKKG